MKKLQIITGILGMLAVILGAFGAHALKSKLTPEQLITYHTGIEYHYYHVLALLGIIALAQKSNHTLWLFRAGICFVIGILFFSGSIYLLACKELLHLQTWTRIIGPITPIGGMFFIVGWLMLVVHAVKNEN